MATRVFFDGWEDGTTNKWRADDNRNLCQVVTTSLDGLNGPYEGTKMVRCNWNGTVIFSANDSFENLVIDSSSVAFTSELFFRFRVRVDMDHERSDGSACKLCRQGSGGYDLYEDITNGSGMKSSGEWPGNQFVTYWGGTSGDHTAEKDSGWHKVERYFKSDGTVRIWHDGVMIRDDNIGVWGGSEWFPFYITSNYSDAHDAANHIYFDKFEVFSDSSSGTATTGLMSNATIEVGSAVGYSIRGFKV